MVGKVKYECLSRPIAELVGLRPKICSTFETFGSNIRKAKCVSKAVVQKDLRHDLHAAKSTISGSTNQTKQVSAR